MTWKTDYRSIYYDGAPEPDDPDLAKASTALLVIDVQNTYLVGRTGPRCPPRNSADMMPGLLSMIGCAKSSFLARGNS
jgi:hypothetical protein